MCNCRDKSRVAKQHVITVAEKYEEVMGEETVLIEDQPDEFVFETTRRPLDRSEYDITVENGRKIYVLKQINKN